jgi:NEDD8-activating enzyme E1 regulatory subunit
LHSHVPFVVILLKAIKKWKLQNDGKVPKSFAEKQEFKDKCVKSLALDFSKEVNFAEALKNSYLLFQDTNLDFNI